MPYPNDAPTAKHDFLIDNEQELLPSSKNATTKSVVDLLDSQALSNATEDKSGTSIVVYSYPDGPQKPGPLSRTLSMIGLILSTSIPSVHKIISSGVGYKCTIGVKKIQPNLPDPDKANSSRFAKFIIKLKKDNMVAITSKDKYGRIGVIKAMDSEIFAAECYLFEDVEQLRNILDSQLSNDTSKSKSLSPAVAGKKRATSEIDDTSQDTKECHQGGYHKSQQAADAEAFYDPLKRNLETRFESRIYHMRNFNGWVKAVQIQELNPQTSEKSLRVLDLACGKGGDLQKWILHPRKIQNYVGIDVARGSLKEAAVRARKLRHKLNRCTFICADLGSDVPGRPSSSTSLDIQDLLSWSLLNDSPNEEPIFQFTRGGGISEHDKFDVVSIQFAIHYVMSTPERARRFFRTVSELLEIGGNLIATTIDARVVVKHIMNLNDELRDYVDGTGTTEAVIIIGGGACQIRFEAETVHKIFNRKLTARDDEDLFGLEYTFTLKEGSLGNATEDERAVDLPEWLALLPVLESLANEVGLELEYVENFHEFFEARKDPATFPHAHSTMRTMHVLNRSGSLSTEEWEICRLYCAIKFRKVR